MERAICGLVNALSWLTGGSPEVKTLVSFDDSIMEDFGAMVDRNLKLLQNGLKSKKRAVMDIMRCSEADAEKMLAEIAREQRNCAYADAVG